jgi:hypothetical protein
MAEPAKVFISYSHDSTEHVKRVLDLAGELRANGVEVILDQYVHPAPHEGWPRWMERCLDEADFVLMVCTETYLRRITGREQPGRGFGATWEGNLVYNSIYNDKPSSTRFIPVLLEGGEPDHIPIPVRGHAYYRIRALDISDAGFIGLYRHLTRQPPTPQPDIGELRNLPPQAPRVPDEDRNLPQPARRQFWRSRLRAALAADKVKIRTITASLLILASIVGAYVVFGPSSDLIVSPIDAVPLQNHPLRRHISTGEPVYTGGGSLDLTLSHNGRGFQSITVLALKIVVHEFVPAPIPQYSYEVEGPVPAGQVKPLQFLVSLRGKEYPEVHWVNDESHSLEPRSENFLDVNGLDLPDLGSHPSEKKIIRMSVSAQQNGYYSCSFRITYRVGAESVREGRPTEKFLVYSDE